MKRFISEHEAAMEAALAAPAVSADLLAYHERQIAHLQAERLAHLLVTLAFALFALLCGAGALVAGSAGLTVALLLLLALLGAYVAHYFRLENAVQRWYRLSRRLERRLGHAPDGSMPGAWG